MNKDLVLLIDANNLMWRSTAGFNKGNYYIIYNFFKSFRSLIDQFKPTKCFFCLEGRPQFRYDLLSTYKANRGFIKTAESKTEQDVETFNKQSKEIVRLLSFLPIQQVRASNFEADDCIYTLCQNLQDEDVIIVSTDQDYIQIIQQYKNVKVYDPIKKEFMKSPSFHFLAFRCLAGDMSDNIPGIASQEDAERFVRTPSLLKKYLENTENKAGFNLNKELIEMKTVPENELIFYDYKIDFAALKKEFDKMEFKSITDNSPWKRFVETFERLE